MRFDVLTFLLILLRPVLRFFMGTEPASTQQPATSINFSNIFLWKRQEEIRQAAILWGVDNSTDTDINVLLESMMTLREELGDDFVKKTVEEVLTDHRLFTVAHGTAIRLRSRLVMQFIHRVNAVVVNIKNITLVVRDLVKGDMGDGKAIGFQG